VSESRHNDNHLIVNAILGKPIYTNNKYKPRKKRERNVEEKIDDLIDRIDDMETEDLILTEDDIFARQFFNKCHLLETSRKYSGHMSQDHMSREEKVDFTSNENFLQFWNTNGQFLTWKLFEEWFPNIPAHLFDDFKNLSKRKQKELEEKWDQVSSRVFSLAQLFYSDECESAELGIETNEATNQIPDSKME